jgi:phenylalanyl-tRNA synthetase alpha chain
MDIAKIQNLKSQAISSVLEAKDDKELERLRINYLGRKGEITQLIKGLPSLEPEEKKELGRFLNDVKKAVEEAIARQHSAIGKRPKLEKEWLDVTTPGKKPTIGHIHPVTQIIWELTEVFEQMGYQIMEGPEVENEHYNFKVLNIPKHHPARDLQDTFWLKNGMLPRTHTSAMQVRVMEKLKPPFKIAVPGWVFRCEREDATHAACFHHYEGFAVGKNISFADLKGTLYAFSQKVLGYETKLQFRASYFPYVEPCAEISASCPHCKGKGCPACGGSGWLEILGSGMIHPIVLKNANIDPKKYSGFAFCPGPTRLAMIKYQVKDIRLFTGGDLRFLNQF